MIKFNKEELLKIAELSALKLHDDEANVLVEQIQLVLNYTKELNQVGKASETAPTKNVNVFRDDKAIQKDNKDILKQATTNEEGYFVVPKILN